MTAVRYLLGILGATLVVLPVGVGARAVRRRLAPVWSGPVAALATFTIGLTSVELTAQILGVFGWFRLLPMLLVCNAVGWATWVVLRRADPEGRPTPVGAPTRARRAIGARRREYTVCGVLVAVVLGSWASRVAGVLAAGMTSYDTLWYHLPTAVRFFQTGEVLPLHFTSLDADMAFFPFNSEILHALGMMTFGSDIASTVANLAWFGVALTAGWTIGHTRGIPHVTTLAVAAVFATPTLVNSGAGTAYTESMSIALLVCAVAFFLEGSGEDGSGPRLLLTGLAAGLAAGTKFTLLVPVGLLAVAVIVIAPRGGRLRAMGSTTAGLLLGGGFWYLRNLFVFGNPLPSLQAGIGPWRLRAIEGLDQSSFAHFLFDGPSWRDYFLPAFTQRIGPLWPMAFLLVLLAGVGVRRGDEDRRVTAIALIGLAGTLAFIVSPQHIGTGGVPDAFALNIRYVAPALCVGLVACSLVWADQRRAVFGTLAALVATSQLSYTTWHLRGFGDRIVELVDPTRVGVGVVLVVAGSVWCWWYLRVPRVTTATSRHRFLGAGLVVLLAFLGVARGPYLDQRYRSMPFFPGLFRWAQTQSDQRIVLEPVGYLDSIEGRPGIETWVQRNILRLQYPLAGQDLSNWNQMAIFLRGDAIDGPRSCTEWVTFLQDHGATRAVVWTQPGQDVRSTDLGRWTASQPGARVILRSPLVDRPTADLEPSVAVVFRLDPSKLVPRC